MSKHLDVYLHESLTGQLQQDKHGRISFSYNPSWLENPASLPLSHSLPLRDEPFAAKECQGFFAGVLPEEENRKIIASILGISARNDFALLEQIGGECAGAVSFLPSGSSMPLADKPSYQKLSEDELAEILHELPQRPLMAGHKEVRLSLAGAQNKLAVLKDQTGIALPLQNSPSTHILKPAIPRFGSSIVQNEAFCMRLAQTVGLPAANVVTGKASDIEYLLAKRYDRHFDHDGKLNRIHQEDFCQALGFPPHIKYQNEGGPSLPNGFALIREISIPPAPDLLYLLDAIIFNVIIGNNDAHGKNFSFLYHANNSQIRPRLAPLYDLVSTAHYPELSDKMAMKIGNKYLSRKTELKHWQALWAYAGLNEKATQKRSLQFSRKVLRILEEHVPLNETEDTIAKASRARTRRLISTFSD